MAQQDFTTTILVDQTPMEVFESIINVRAWWPGEIEGGTGKLNDEFTYKYKTYHYSKQKLIEVIPGKKIVWLVTESSLNFVQNKTEWTGTKMIFEIAEKGKQTQLRFTHQGLVPAYECFNDCSNAWGEIINNNLRDFISAGKKTTTFLPPPKESTPKKSLK